MEDLKHPKTQSENWQIREDLKYDSNNFWIRIEDREAVVGLTDYGQWAIGDILYFDIARPGSSICRGERVGSIESGKWVGSLVSPVSGVVLEVNSTLNADPRQINMDPYGMGWIIKVALAASHEDGTFWDHLAYAEYIKKQLREEEL